MTCLSGGRRAQILNVSGSLDICYYNFLCAHRAGALSDFNHVLSNLGYLLLGALFLLQVRRRRLRRRRHPRHQVRQPARYIRFDNCSITKSQKLMLKLNS